MTRAKTPPPSARPPLRKPQQLDGTCKNAMGRDGGAILDLVLHTSGVYRDLGLPDAVPELLAQLPTEFERGDLDSDDLLLVRMGGVEFLLDTEYQSAPDGEMGLRVSEYQLAAYKEHRKPVYSVVFNVQSKGALPVSVRKLAMGGQTVCWVEVCVPQAVHSWPRRLSSPLAVVLRALMGGLGLEELRECLGQLEGLGLDRRTCRDLVEAVCLLIDRWQGGDGSRFEQVRNELITMLQLEETWLYQKGLDKGMSKGLDQGQNQGLIKAIATMAENLGTPLSPQRAAALQQRSVEELLTLVARIQQNRRLDD